MKLIIRSLANEGNPILGTIIDGKEGTGIGPSMIQAAASRGLSAAEIEKLYDGVSNGYWTSRRESEDDEPLLEDLTPEETAPTAAESRRT